MVFQCPLIEIVHEKNTDNAQMKKVHSGVSELQDGFSLFAPSDRRRIN